LKPSSTIIAKPSSAGNADMAQPSKKSSRPASIKVELGLIAGSLLLPVVLSESTTGNLAYCMVWVFGAIGLAAMWGYGGILSFGQTAFFGLAGYAYGIFTINFGDSFLSTWSGFTIALAICIIVALLLGYMIFYGGIKDVFIGIVTLSVTLVLETFMAQTAGPQWVVGQARLNGYNGMSAMPSLTIPTLGGENLPLEGIYFYYLVVILLFAVYFLSRKLLGSSFGLTLEAIRENPQRAQMLGIDIRRYQLFIFVFGSTLGGMSGVLYTVWGSYITPSSMGLTAAAMPVIWVATGGRKSIGGVIAATIGLVWLSQWLAIYGSQYALILMGCILLFVVLGAPEGLLPMIGRALNRKARKGTS
jgi:ABC-type branched-subunit amino acid transport system permease subunit